MIPKATSILGKSIIIYYLLRRERDPFVFVFFFQLFWNILRRCCRSIYLFLTSCIVDDVRDGASWGRFAFNLVAIGSLRWSFFDVFSRRHDRRPTGAVRLWQCGIICGTCERRDAAPLVANLSIVCIAQARKYVFRPVHGRIRISLDHHLNVTRTIFSYKR